MSLSSRTGRSLHEGPHTVIGPANPRPTCKRCGGKWTGTHLLLCSACEEEHLDLMADAQDEQDAAEDLRESDREIVL